MSIGSESGSDRLATYGSLMPGGQHHDLVSDLEVLGSGVVRGVVRDWEGYPMLSIDSEGDEVAVVVLGGVTSRKWRELDAFEGPAYRRDEVSVQLAAGKVLVATCYVATLG